MKKAAFYLILLLAAGQLFGQQYETKKGFIVGLNISNWNGKDADQIVENLNYIFNSNILGTSMSSSGFSKSARIGFSIGGFLEQRMSNTMVFQPELHWTMLGCKVDGDVVMEGYKFDTKANYIVNYIQIPALFKYSRLRNDYTSSFTFFAGPYVAVKAGSKLHVEISYQGDSESEEEDLDDIEGIDFGVIAGAGIDFPSGITINLRYSQGFTKVVQNMQVQNNNISILMGFAF